MEPVSLTLGAVSLAGLFSLCIQCFDLIEIGRKTSVDYEIMVVKLSIEKRRLMVWGEAVGILRPDQDRDPLLDDLETWKLVERILSNVQRLFDETQNLKSKYGLEKTSSTQNSPKAIIQGSAVCSLSFESSPLVQFHTGFSEHIRKVGLVEKTRWAIRDSKKFAALIQDLKDLLDGLGEITISSRSTILKGQLIREETQSMSDLKMLTVIEQTCSDTDWRSSASSASTYFINQNRLTTEGREDIQKWMQVCPRREVAEGIFPGQDHGQTVPDINGIAYESSQLAVSLYPPPHTRQSSPSSSSRLRLKTFDTPYEKTDTQVLVLCSTHALKAWIPKTDKTFYPVYKIPQTTTANAITASRMTKAIVVPPHFHYPSITIYCPPRMRFVHMALSILNPRADVQEMAQTQFHIRFDDRLLDRTTSFSGITERMRGYHRDIENCFSTRDSSQQRILDSIDMNWLEQRIEVLDDPSYQPVLDTLEWSTIFRQSKDDTHCAGIIIMAGEDTCWKMFNTAPVVPPDTFQDGRVYRLRELDGGEPMYKWKAEHYCNVSADLKYKERFSGG